MPSLIDFRRFNKWKVLGVVLLSCLFLFAEIRVWNSNDYHTRALVMRAQFMLFLQCILLTFSYKVIWKNYKDLPCHLYYVFTQQNARDSHSSASGGSSQSVRYSSQHQQRGLNEECGDSNFEIERRIGRKTKNLWKLIVILYLVLCHSCWLLGLFSVGTEPKWLTLFAYICLGSFIQLVLGLLMFKIVSVCVQLFRSYKISIPYKSSQPGINKSYILSFALIYAVIASTWGFYIASLPPSIKHVDIPVKDLPQTLHGLSIIQLSDIHMGPTVGQSRLKVIVDLVNREDADLVVLTGDLVDGKAHILKEATHQLGEIKPKYGKYYVTGNHEYYTADLDNWFILLSNLGFTILHNTNVNIPQNNGRDQQICLAGTDDLQADNIKYGDHRFDLPQALSSCDPSLPVILLAHQPKAARRALDSQYRVDLVLSGHTHGGQMFPLMIGAYLLNPFFAGLYSVGPSSHVYVSRGTQFWGIPMRLGAPMEITRITLIPN